jgi:hypothetical protein
MHKENARMKKYAKPILAVAIVVVGAGLLWWFIAGGGSKPTPKDYDAAQKTAVALHTSYQQLEKSFNTYEASASSTNKTAYQKAYDDYQAKLANTDKVVGKLHDDALQAKYDAFNSKSAEFTGYVSGYVADYATGQKLATADCVKTEKIFTGTADTMVKEYDARVKACQAQITTLKQSSNDGLVTYGKQIDQLLQDRRAALVAAQAKIKNGDSAAIQVEIGKVAAIKTPDLAQDLLDARQKAGAIKQLEAFNNALAEKTAQASKNK